MNADPLRAQYEALPYPPIPWMALPARGEGQSLRFEHGLRLAGLPPRGHTGIRVLVAGCGTFEPLVAGQANPLAEEIVALDLSERSIGVLRKRAAFARSLARGTAGLLGRKLPPIRPVRADLVHWDERGEFDLILASNVLHHLPDPGAGLGALARRLAPGGLLRVVTYPRHSRLWIRAAGAWLRSKGVDPSSARAGSDARAAVRELPAGHPFRSAFESQPETRSVAGLVDAFLNARENPLSPLEWEGASRACGLALVAEEQTETSRSSFLLEILPETRALSRWERLQALDELLELCANPVLWFVRSGENEANAAASPARLARLDASPTSPAATLESALEETCAGLRRALALLGRAGVDAGRLRSTLEREVGPRVTAGGKPLPGLSLLDYDWARWL